MMCEVYLSLGSNMPDRIKNLEDAVESLSHINCTMLNRVSDIYETEPVGYVCQGRFLNMAVSVVTGLEPRSLFAELQKIETSLGRTREIRWGPRTIDIDILLFDGFKVELPDLVIPHPRMFERAFVLVPLKDIYPESKINGLDLEELMERCSDRDGVRLYRNVRR